MEARFPRAIATTQTQAQQTDATKMSTLTMSAPYHHSGFQRELSWQSPRPTEYTSRPRQEPEKIALPSIRQAFPEFSLSVEHPERGNLTPSSTTSPTVGPPRTLTPPEYVHSPNSNKRRRLSLEDEREMERANQVPRLYENPARNTRQQSPPRSVESWPPAARGSPYLSQPAGHPMQSPRLMEVRDRADSRPTLPSLPALTAERESYPIPRSSGLPREDYRQEQPRLSLPHTRGPSLEPNAPPYRSPSFGYGFHHPNRPQSLSVGSAHPYDRAPFTHGAYGPHYQDSYMRIGELGMGLNGDNKQRKRRGNLPKETTDKLRAWFVGHLHHPYPTEDEKQELMRQTGLQMNQISNWFINARRRQLPTLINNARVETDAMSGRGSDGKVITSTERGVSDYDRDSKRGSVPLSDGEASNYDDMDLEALKRRRAAATGRGSV